MTDGNTLIVDVVSSGDGYMLNDTPVNMMIAYEVVRRHVTDSGTFYSQMTKKQKTAEGYSFVFDTGDTFTCTSDTAYPTSATLNDAKPAELPAVTAADVGKVLGVNDSGVWGASYLYGSDRRIQIGAVKSNGVWTTNTQITPDKFIEGLFNGYDFQLYAVNTFSHMTLVVSDYNTYAIFEATTQTQERVLVTFNGFDGEYVTITIEPFSTDFIVTLTPDALDYSGTMDKTVAEINAAYEAGRKIVFKMYTSATTFIEVPAQLVGHDNTFDYPSFEASVVQPLTNLQILAQTGLSSDGTKQTYDTTIYTLTPAT